MTTADRFMLVDALTKAAKRLGWRPAQVESSEWLVTFVVLAPLAESRPERNRWPDEPEEGEEPTQEEREREWAPDWDVEPEPLRMLSGEVRGGGDDLAPYFDPDEVYKEQNKLAEKYDSDDRSTGRGGGWSTKIVRGDDGAQ